VGSDIIGEENMILNRDVPGKGHAIRKNIIVSDIAVMSNVNSNHKKVSRSDPSCLSLSAGAVQSAELADCVFVAYYESASFVCELYILRFATKHCVLEDTITGSQRGIALDNRVGTYLASVADLHIILDDSVRPNTNILRDSGPLAHNTGRMSIHGFP
jgi:hypothetical protein